MTHQPHLNQPRLDLQQQWCNVKKILQGKPIIMQRNIRGLLSNKAKEWKSNLDNTTKTPKCENVRPLQTLARPMNITPSQVKKPASLMSHSCKGTLCQVRLLQGIGIQHYVKREGESCIERMEEERGWTMAKHVEQQIFNLTKKYD